MNYLLNAQNFILENTRNGYYAKAYKDAEYTYWNKVYEWIVHKRPKVTSCLDIGCAYGTWLAIIRELYPSCNLFGIDFVNKCLSSNVIQKLNLQFAVKNVQTEDISFSQTFDLVILTEVLEHFNINCIPTLSKIVFCLSDDGYLFLTTPNSDHWGKINFEHWSELPSTFEEYIDGHIYQFNIEEIKEIANILKIKPIMLSTNDFGHINGIFQKVVF